jgi:hypothetical protein
MFMAEQAEWFTVGELGEQAGISGSTELKQLATEVTARVAAQEGINLESMPIPQTGQGAGAAAAAGLKAAWSWLSKAAGKIVGKLSANIALVATLGGVYIAYEWITAEDQLLREKEQQLGTAVRTALENATPAQKKEILGSYMKKLGATGITTKHVVIGGLVVAGFYIAYRWFGPNRRR